MKTIEEVMSEVNRIFGLKENQSLTHKEKVDLLQTVIENDRATAHASGYRQGQITLERMVLNVFSELPKS